MTTLPMFPLGTVLVPSMLLPLQVFEPRYRTLVRDCLAGEPEFGVVLIERGSEVGGGDVRTDVGTVARMIDVAARPDGRFLLQTVGTRRIRVRRWLDDAPYPRAEVDDWPDEPDGDAAPLLDGAWDRLHQALLMHAELGDGPPAGVVERAEDSEVASHQITALSPLGAFDRQRLLAAAGTVERLRRVSELLDEAIEVLRARLDAG